LFQRFFFFFSVLEDLLLHFDGIELTKLQHVKQSIDQGTGMVDFAKVFRGIETELAAEGKFDCEGCTATVVFIHRRDGKRFLQVANVGDSTAFLRFDVDLLILLELSTSYLLPP